MKTKNKCEMFIAKYCCKDNLCEVYRSDYTSVEEISAICVRCKYNVGCRECLHYEYCENRGKYE